MAAPPMKGGKRSRKAIPFLPAAVAVGALGVAKSFGLAGGRRRRGGKKGSRKSRKSRKGSRRH